MNRNTFYTLAWADGTPVEIRRTGYGDRLSASRDAAWWAAVTGRPVQVSRGCRVSGLPFPNEMDDAFLEDLGIVRTPHGADVTGWRVERWQLTGSDEGAWIALTLFPFQRLDDAIRLVWPGDRIVNVETGRVVLES